MILIRALVESTWYYLCMGTRPEPFMYPSFAAAWQLADQASADRVMKEISLQPLFKDFNLQIYTVEPQAVSCNG